MAIDVIDHVTHFFLGHQLVDQFKRTGRIIWQQISKLGTTRCCFNNRQHALTTGITGWHTCLYLGMQADRAIAQCQQDFLDVGKGHAFALFTVTDHRHVIKAKDDILRWHNDRLAVGRAEDVICRHHQHARFKLGFKRQRHMHGHLVTVKVSVKCRTDQRMQLNGLAFDQNRLECLNAKTVQGWRAIEHHRMLADHLFKNIPDFGTFFFHHALGHLHRTRHRIKLKL